MTSGTLQGIYELRFRNREVETAFFEELLPLYVPEIENKEYRALEYRIEMMQ